MSVRRASTVSVAIALGVITSSNELFGVIVVSLLVLLLAARAAVVRLTAG